MVSRMADLWYGGALSKVLPKVSVKCEETVSDLMSTCVMLPIWNGLRKGH